MRRVSGTITIAVVLLFSAFTQSFAGALNHDAALHEYDVVKDIEWARPGGHSLTMDIYTPKTGKASYPVLVIFHGGGWLINDKSPMTSMSEYVAEHAEYVVCNVNYRLLVHDDNTITMNQMVEDVMGAVLWIKDNIASYKGDPAKLCVTGDSAGGHLAEMIVVAGDKLESDGFAGDSQGYNPTYLPAGKTAEDVAKNDGLAVQAAIISYGAFDIYAACLGGYEKPSNMFWQFAGKPARGIFGDSVNAEENAQLYKAIPNLQYTEGNGAFASAAIVHRRHEGQSRHTCLGSSLYRQAQRKRPAGTILGARRPSPCVSRRRQQPVSRHFIRKRRAASSQPDDRVSGRAIPGLDTGRNK